MQKEGKCVCYVGDGINDALALQQADVSVSLRGASTIARDTAQIILMGSRVNQLVDLFNIADKFKRNMDTCFLALSLPMVLGIGGVFIFQFGLLYTVLLNTVGLSTGMAVAMLPLRQQHGTALPGHILAIEKEGERSNHVF